VSLPHCFHTCYRDLRCSFFLWLLAWNFKQIVICLSTPTVRSWLNLWGVMAASLLPFMMKVMVSVSLEVLSLVILVLVLLALTQWWSSKSFFWSSLCNLLDLLSPKQILHILAHWRILSISNKSIKLKLGLQKVGEY